MSTSKPLHELDNNTVDLSAPSRLSMATYSYEQDARSIHSLSARGLAELVRLGYIKPHTEIRSANGRLSPLAQDDGLMALLADPFANIPDMRVPVAPPVIEPPAPVVAPPSLLARFASLMIDTTIVNIMSVVLTLMIWLSLGFGFWLSAAACWLLCASLYFGLNESGAHGATLGKRLLGLKVVSAKNHPIGVMRGLWRGLLKSISIGLLPITGVITMSSKNKSALHDQLAQTKVVKR